MGIWWRSGKKSAALFLYGRRSFNVPAPLHRSRLIKQDIHIILPLLHPHSNAQSSFARSYSGLVKVKAKEGDGKIQAVNEHDGPRLNAEITAQEVRLVSEKGHEVIPRWEALARAKKLKLDLVEVQRHANPPVCKLMDYNKEKYKQQQREKERTKNKSELILRKSECREIRFTSKTEQKDLERKAEMAKRLMERGYRVKCMAMGPAQEKLEEQLLRLSTLIEDFSIVESGPRVEKKGAWLIVKHVKFGHTKRNETQQTPKSIEIGVNEMERDNTKKPSDNKNKKERVVSPQEALKGEQGQSEEYALLEKFREFASEDVSNTDRVKGIPYVDVLFTSETKDKTLSLNEEFKEDRVPFEEHHPIEHFQEFAAEEVPSIDRIEEIPPANFLFTSEIKVHTKNSVKQESVVVNSNNYTKTETKFGDSINEHDSFVQAKKNLADTHSILHDHNTSNRRKQFPLDQPPKQSLGPTKDKASESLKQGHSFFIEEVEKYNRSPEHIAETPNAEVETAMSERASKLTQVQKIQTDTITTLQGHSSLPAYTNLNIGPEKQDHLGQYDCKPSVPVDGLRQVTVEKIHSDQGHHASNVGKSQSEDSVSERASGSITANAKDIPGGHQFHVSLSREVTNNIVEELQTPPIKLNYVASTQDQQKGEIGTPKISAASLRQALLNRSSGSQEKTGKRSFVDILPKKASESRWAILKQVKPSCFDDNNNSTPATEVASNIVEDMQTSPVNLNDGAGAQDSQKMTIGGAQISASGLRQVLVACSSGDKEKVVSEIGKQPLEDMLSKQGNESRWAILGHHKPSRFDDNNNTTATSEKATTIFEELQTSPVKLNDDAATQDQQHMALGSPEIAADGLGQVFINCSSSNLEISALETGKQPLISKQPNESKWETFREIKSSNFECNNNTVAQGQLGVSNDKHRIVNDDTRQDPPCPNPSNQGHHISNIGKHIPVASTSAPAKVSGEIHGIFSQGRSSTVDVNESALTKTEIVVKNTKQTTPSEHKRQDLSAVRSSLPGYPDTRKATHKPLDSSPKQANNIGVSTSGISKELPVSSVQVTKNAKPRESLEIANSKNTPWDDAREVPGSDSPSGQENHSSVTGKQPPINLFSKQASTSGDSRWSVFSHPKSSVVENQRHATKAIEDQSKPSSFDCNSDVTSNSDQGKRAPNKGKQPLSNMHPKQVSESPWTTFRQIKPSRFEGDNNTTTEDQPGVSNAKQHANNDGTKKEYPSPSSQGHNVSNIGKQIPRSLASMPIKVSKETSGILSQGQSTSVSVNGATPTQTENGVENAKQTTVNENKRQDISAVISSPLGYSSKTEVLQNPLDLSPKQAGNTGVSAYGISKELQLSSDQVSNTVMPRDSLKTPNSNTLPWDDARKNPAVYSPSDQGSQTSVTGKQSPTDSYFRQASASGGSRWGIFSQPKSSVVENQRHPAKTAQDQSKKEQSNILWGPNIGASDEAQNDAHSRHLHIQNQRKVPINSTSISKQDPKQTENKAVDEPKQKGWGIFSKKVLAKPSNTKGNPKM